MQQSIQSSVDAIEAERFRQFIMGVTDYAIYMLSPEGVVVTWNAGAQRFKGYHPDEIIGRHFSMFYTDEDRAAGRPVHALQVARTAGKFEDEGWRVRKDGSRFWASVVIDPIVDPQGELLGFAKITRDITERRVAAEQLERAREALFQSQKLEAIGKLTGGIAHDFNNLLNVIMNGLELLRLSRDPAVHAKSVDTMSRAAQRGASLTQQLLAFARQQPLRQEAHDAGRVIRSFEAVLRRALPDDMRLHLQLDSDLPQAMLDPTQFESALLNLVVNARDAMEGVGEVQLELAAVTLAAAEVAQLPAGRYVRVVVRDQGTGMTPEVMARAVEPFFTTKEVGKGTGLGLSQVYGLMQQCHGMLTLDSHPGEGTAVSMYFPAVEGGDLDDENAAAGTEQVLLVDDQPEVLETAISLFSHLGYEVLAADNGEQALETLRSNPGIAILFSDVVMPGMSGVELGKAARQEFPDLKIVLASGYVKTALRDEMPDIGNFEMIAKPYRLSDLIRTLKVL
ncbi:PAS domain S-box protein [Pseudoduganella sp. FT25W]|uniref:histidine kinase n=1 Tax=Duganella alba TaxID=2666081 RepID=A0A6L5QMD2_9BURK|nr:PAS domain-containing sensor histidine kinase [Duganella alba]MRX10101.1 PAS domain S-box protein [Duganella alba]MRX16711.1 PAS domain S-box protein [Duganella alba]